MTDLPDADDETFQTPDIGADLGYRLDTVTSASPIFQRRMEKGLPKKEVLDKDEVRRIIVKKKYFPDPREPNLLTWIEKQLVRKLHKEDPLTWTSDELSECFPVTPRGVKHILKSTNTFTTPESIVKHDEKVKQNWKLLSSGKLENSRPIEEHFKKIGYKIFNEEKRLSNTEVKELEQSILKEFSDSLVTPKPNLTGEFGMILVNHRKRLGQMKASDEADKNVVQAENLLNSDEDFYHSLNPASPYGGTSLLNAVSNSRYDKNLLTVDEFRKRLWNEMKFKAKSDPIAKEYFQWLRTEKNLLKKAEAPIAVDEISELNKLPNTERFIEKYAPKVEKPIPRKQDHIQLKIDVPKHVEKNEVYQVNDCFYDSNGELIYRIPGLNRKI